MNRFSLQYAQTRWMTIYHVFFIALFCVVEFAIALPVMQMPGNWQNLVFFQTPISSAVTLTFAAGYVGIKLAYVHPLWDQDYLDWLRQVPWPPGSRLPLGDIHFGILDYLYMAGMSGLLIVTGQLSPWLVPAVMFGTFAAIASFPQVKLGDRLGPFLIGFLVATVPLCYRQPVLVCGLMLGAYVIAIVSWKKSLLRFLTWPIWNPRPPASRSLGYPWELTSPAIQYSIEKRSIHPADALAISILIAYGVATCAWGMNLMFAIGGSILCLFCFAARIESSLRLWKPPNSLLSRLKTGQLINSAYDRLFLGPLLILLVSIPYFLLLKTLSTRVEFPGPHWDMLLTLIASSVLLGLLSYLILAGPPRISKWTLMGGYNSHRSSLRNKRLYKACQ